MRKRIRLQRLKSGKKFFLHEDSNVEWTKAGYNSDLQMCVVRVLRSTHDRFMPGFKFVYI